MVDFLLELLSEEIPARMQEKACADLARLFAAELAKAGLAAAAIETYATPRRLALIARDLPAATEGVREETKGPRASAPPQALEGFLRKTGLAADQLVERDGTLFAIVEKPGRATTDVLADAIPAVIRAFPWPKSMRWGAASASTASLRWVRPLQGIVALFGEDVVPFEVEGIASGAATVGHRFHHPGPITIGSAADYADKLRMCHVILDPAERRAIIEEGARALAETHGLHIVPDAGLVAENAGLTEWPVPLLGDFDPAFLRVPREVIQLTMRTNQKYFALTDGEGRLAPAFVCTANIDAADGGAAIVAGNRKVLAARLSDARFFWEQDLKVPLEERAPLLLRYVEKLGTFADKTSRMRLVARWLSQHVEFPGIVRGQPANLSDLADRAAYLALLDQPTQLVAEFPELEGVIGGYYAAAQGEDRQIAAALRTQYKPRGPADPIPVEPLSIIQALSFKIETRVAFFVGGIVPKGSGDPFGVRRTELGIIRIIVENGVRLNLRKVLQVPFHEKLHAADCNALLESFADRLKVQQREAGVRHDLIDAVFALGGEDDLVRLLARVKALQAFVETGEGANLLAGYKRAANILKKEGYEPPLPAREGSGVGAVPQGSAPASAAGRDPADRAPTPDPSLAGRGEEKSLSYTPEPREAALIAALDGAEVRVESAVAQERFADAMAALAGLRAPIDAFFEAVTVNDPDPAKRAARLGLLARIRGACHRVADFSRIEG